MVTVHARPGGRHSRVTQCISHTGDFVKRQIEDCLGDRARRRHDADEYSGKDLSGAIYQRKNALTLQLNPFHHREPRRDHLSLCAIYYKHQQAVYQSTAAVYVQAVPLEYRQRTPIPLSVPQSVKR